MNKLDNRKCFRGVLLWREDVLKCARIVRKPLSGFVRELLHAELEKHRLSAEDQEELDAQVVAAARKREENRGKTKRRVLTVDRIDLPKKVRTGAKFVKAEV